MNWKKMEKEACEEGLVGWVGEDAIIIGFALKFKLKRLLLFIKEPNQT